MPSHEVNRVVAVTFRLREVLDAAGISQSEASRRSGVSFATINRMCTNATRQVSLDVVDALCGMLGVEPGELLEREGKRRRKGG
jgi:DNA-binding Xre family transcriptional regulator